MMQRSRYVLEQFFLKENVRNLVWICRDPISLILGLDNLCVFFFLGLDNLCFFGAPAFFSVLSSISSEINSVLPNKSICLSM